MSPARSTEKDKDRLRRDAAARVRAVAPEQRLRWDRAIQRRLLAAEWFHEARTVQCYLSLPEEVSTELVARAVLGGGKRLTAPVVRAETRELFFARIEDYDRGLRAGYGGIREPAGPPYQMVPPEEIDLFVVPGMAYDAQGHRLGRGLGYYDRCLAGVKGRAVICAPAYELQIVDRVPAARHDVPVDVIVTETRTIELWKRTTRGRA